MLWGKTEGKKYLTGMPFLPAGCYGKFQFVGLTESEFKAAILPLVEKNTIALFLDTDQQNYAEGILGVRLDPSRSPKYGGLKRIEMEDTLFICRVSHMLPGAEGYTWELAMLRRIPA